MATESALLVIVVLLVLILAVQFILVVWMRSFMTGMHEVISERIVKPNADLDKLMKKRDFSRVISEITDHRLAHSDDPALYWYRGLAHFHLKQTSDALTMLERAIDLEPAYEKDLMPYLNKLDRPSDL